MSLNFGAITTGVQTVTATGAVTPTAGLNTATHPATTEDFTIFVQVQSLTDGKKARIVIEETNTAFGGSVWIPLLIYDVEGVVASAYDLVKSVRKAEVPSTLSGTTGAYMRANVQALDSAASLALRAWVEY
jgi:hypothetical protein